MRVVDVKVPDIGDFDEMEPVWDGKAFVPCLKLPLSLTWDQRVIDGAAVARFKVCPGQILGDSRCVLLRGSVGRLLLKIAFATACFFCQTHSLNQVGKVR